MTRLHPVAERDANGHETRFSHDESGRLVGVTQWPDAAGAPSLAFITSYGFDDRGNMVSQQDALGRVTRYGFDDAGRRTSRTLPLLQREALTHATDGSLQSRRSFGGALTEHERGHDSSTGHRQDVVDLPPGELDIVTTYWGDGQRHVVTDSSGTTTHGRDLTTGRLTSVTRDEAATGGLDSTITYGHDLSGNVTSIETSVNGNPAHVVTRDHDAAGRITKVGDALGRAEYEYTPSGQLYRVRYFQAAATEPFVVGEYEHDALTGGIRSITWRAGESSPGVPGPLLRSFTYELDEMGRRTAATETQAGGGTRVVTWTSDDLYRLESESVTEADLTQWAVTHAYDRVGNRLTRVRTGTDAGSVAYAFDANDRLLAVNEQDYDWDAEGNLSRRDGSEAYDWDAQDRLTGIEGWSFVYDANGLKRVATSPDGTVTTEVVDETFPHAQVIEERWSEGPASRVKRYLRGVQPVRIDVGGQSWWYLHDALGSTRALVQPGGSLDATVVTDERDYQAFGEVAREWHAATGACGVENRWLYAGEERNEGFGLDYLRARWMEPGVGRFLSFDSARYHLEDPQTNNLFLYVANRPTALVDPSGRDWSIGQQMIALGVGAIALTAATFAPVPLNKGSWHKRYRPIIEREAARARLSPRFLAAVILTEQRYAFAGVRAKDWVLTVLDTNQSIGEGQVTLSTGIDQLGLPPALPGVRFLAYSLLSNDEINIGVTASYLRDVADAGAALEWARVPDPAGNYVTLPMSILAKDSAEWGSTPEQHMAWMRIVAGEYTSRPWDAHFFRGELPVGYADRFEKSYADVGGFWGN